MSKFTPGKWWIAPPIFDGDAIFAPAQEKGRRNEVVATGILNKADARLIAAAPEMYEAITECADTLEALKNRDDSKEAAEFYEVEELIHYLWELLARIDGEEAEHE